MIMSVPWPELPNRMRLASSMVINTNAPMTGPNKVPTPPRMAIRAILMESWVPSTEGGSMNSSFWA